MILALDVAYEREGEIVGLVEFAFWSAGEPDYCGRLRTQAGGTYIPGQFYKRELPCLLEALRFRNREYECIVIDGYVDLEGAGRKGLGRHLYEAIEQRSCVVGVAKNRLKIAIGYVPVYRGGSRRPLFVSAAGLPPAEAADRIKSMAGAHRIPTMLKLADRLTRAEVAGCSAENIF